MILKVEYVISRLLAHIGFCTTTGHFKYDYWPFVYEEYFETASMLTLDQTVNDITPTEDDLVMVVRFLGWGTKPLRAFLANVQKWAEQNIKDRAETAVMIPWLDSFNLGFWRFSKYVMSRPLDTIKLDDDIKRPLIQDLGNFLSLSTKQ